MKKLLFVAALLSLVMAACTKPQQDNNNDNDNPGPDDKPAVEVTFQIEVEDIEQDAARASVTPSDLDTAYYAGYVRAKDYVDDETIVDNDIAMFEQMAEAGGMGVPEVIASMQKVGKTEIRMSGLFPSAEYIVYAYTLDSMGSAGKVSKTSFNAADGFGIGITMKEIRTDGFTADIEISDKEVEYLAFSIMAEVVDEYPSVEDWIIQTQVETGMINWFVVNKGDIVLDESPLLPDTDYYIICFRYPAKEFTPPVFMKSFRTLAE